MKCFKFALAVMMVMVSSLTFAQEGHEQGDAAGPDGMCKMCMMKKKEGKGMMGGGMMGGGMMGGGMMNKAQMVSSNDGGVIILTGNKLTKYDNQLNLVKEVELKMPDMPMKKEGKVEPKEDEHAGHR